MESGKLSNGKEREEHINSLKNEIKNSETNSTKTESKEVPVTTKLDKRDVKIVMDYDKLSEEEVYSKFADKDELHKYIKEKGYKGQRKSRKKTATVDDIIVTKIADIVNDKISETEKIRKIKDIIEEQNRLIKLKKQLSIKEKEKKNFENKLNKINKEIEDLNKQIKGN